MALSLKSKRSFEHVTNLVAGVRVIADTGARRQCRRADDDYFSRHARLIIALKNGTNWLPRALGSSAPAYIVTASAARIEYCTGFMVDLTFLLCVRDAIDDIIAIFAQQQRAVLEFRGGDRPSPDIAVVDDESC